MDKQTVLLKEWEQRYESYREYRMQYLTGLSILFSVWFIAIGYVLTKPIDKFHKLTILALISIIVIAMIVAHYVVRSAVTKLAKRIKSLEEQLGIAKFETAEPLEIALRISNFFFWIGELITITLLFYALHE